MSLQVLALKLNWGDLGMLEKEEVAELFTPASLLMPCMPLPHLNVNYTHVVTYAMYVPPSLPGLLQGYLAHKTPPPNVCHVCPIRFWR